jgi:hypothetical protein
MLVDHKWMQAVVAVIALYSVQAYATETEKDLSQKPVSEDSASSGETTERDILAGIDLKSVVEQDDTAVKPEKPTFEKPVFEKPVFEKPKL